MTGAQGGLTAVVVGPDPEGRAAATLAGLRVEAEVVAAGQLPAGLAAIAERLACGRRTLLVDGRSVLSLAAAGRLADDPSLRTGLLVTSDPRAGTPLRTVHGQVVSAGSEHHEVSQPSSWSLGALVVQPEDAIRAASALQEMASAAAENAWEGDLVDHVVVALVRRDIAVRAVEAPGLSARTADGAERQRVAALLDGGEDERALRASGNRVDDGFYSTFVLRRLSKPLTEVALRLGMSPNQVSLTSLVVGLLAAGLFGVAGFWATLAGAVLLQASIVIDCVDGEVARRTRRFSDLGAWLDASTDRVKEYAVYAGLAVAASPDAWLLAGAVLVMQTTRHMTDYAFNRVQRARETWVAPLDLAEPHDGGAPSYGVALDASRRASGRTSVRWAKKALHMPIGERWLVISVVSVAAGPIATLATLLALGLVAAAYTTAGRLLRVRAWVRTAQRSGAAVLQPQLDLGPVASGLWRPAMTSRMAWAGPAALRLLELGLVLGVTRGVAPEALPWGYALCFVLAFHHYDSLYRALGGSAPPAWLVHGGLGVEGRLVVIVIASLLGASVLTGVLVAGTLLLAAWFVVVASVQFVRGLLRGREVAV
jgi:hypothetical protein